MNDYREFQGKTLDAAIREACEYYDVPREKLDIDIVSDAKGGIFGIVGARKATIRARIVRIESLMDALNGEPSREGAKKPAQKERPEPDGEKERGYVPKKEMPQSSLERVPEKTRENVSPTAAGGKKPRSRGRGKPRSTESAEALFPVEAAKSAIHAEKKSALNTAKNGGDVAKPAPRSAKLPQEAAKTLFAEDDDTGEDLPRAPLSSLDEQVVIDAAREVIARLVAPLLGECSPEVRIEGETLRVTVEAGDDPGLLIGREGQNLAAMQYLATRMLANKLQCRVKLHVDAGDYRQRQDDRLRELALFLADKVRASGKPQLTRPLSSYQRRVIHVTLQEDEDMQTHSKGEGDMKRVVVAPRKK